MGEEVLVIISTLRVREWDVWKENNVGVAVCKRYMLITLVLGMTGQGVRTRGDMEVSS
jgi:hypothetical protein